VTERCKTRAPAFLLVTLVALVALSLSACGGDQAWGGAGGRSGATPPVASPSPADGDSVAAVERAQAFFMPSRNVSCVFRNQAVTCDIASGVRLVSGSAGGVCGPTALAGLTLGLRGIRWDCRTGVLLTTAPVLPYGASAVVGDLRCASRSTGVTCTDRVNGDTFTESRESTTTNVQPSR
jgi:hypothetical protein